MTKYSKALGLNIDQVNKSEDSTCSMLAEPVEA